MALSPAQRIAIKQSRLGMSNALGRAITGFLFDLPEDASRKQIEDDPEAVIFIMETMDQLKARREQWRQRERERAFAGEAGRRLDIPPTSNSF